jgi:hypothetical protein
MEPCVYFYITQRRGQDASWAFLAKWLPISLQKMIGILLMHPLKTLASKHLATRFSIDTRPTPANSSPNDRPSSAHASPLKQYDRLSQSSSLSPCDRNIPSFSPCDRPNHRPTPASDHPTASDRQDFRQSLSLCDRPFSGSDFGPCDRPTHGPSDRPPQCKTLSLRRESAKRSACLSTVPSVQTFGANWPNDAALNFWVPLGAVVEGRSAKYDSLSPQGMTSAERSWIPSSPTPAAGATA